MVKKSSLLSEKKEEGRDKTHTQKMPSVKPETFRNERRVFFARLLRVKMTEARLGVACVTQHFAHCRG